MFHFQIKLLRMIYVFTTAQNIYEQNVNICMKEWKKDGIKRRGSERVP